MFFTAQLAALDPHGGCASPFLSVQMCPASPLKPLRLFYSFSFYYLILLESVLSSIPSQHDDWKHASYVACTRYGAVKRVSLGSMGV